MERKRKTSVSTMNGTLVVTNSDISISEFESFLHSVVLLSARPDFFAAVDKHLSKVPANRLHGLGSNRDALWLMCFLSYFRWLRIVVFWTVLILLVTSPVSKKSRQLPAHAQSGPWKYIPNFFDQSKSPKLNRVLGRKNQNSVLKFCALENIGEGL